MKRGLFACVGVVVAVVAIAALLRPTPGHANVENGMAGSGSAADPYQITNCVELQKVTLNLESQYILANDIDCSDTVNWNSGAGFIPIGLNPDDQSYGNYRGTFDGRGHTISGIFVSRPSSQSNYVGTGLFSRVAQAHLVNFTMANATIEAAITDSSYVYVGGVVGLGSDNSSISSVHFDGDITVAGCGANSTVVAGGLVGTSGQSQVRSSSATGTLQTSDCPSMSSLYAGGLAGTNDYSLVDSFSSMSIEADVSSTSYYLNRNVGGLVGLQYAIDGYEISRSYASGDITTTANPAGIIAYKIGGLVGRLVNSPNWPIRDSFAASAISLPGPCDEQACGSSGNRVAGAIIGDVSDAYPPAQSSSYYDQTAVGLSVCDGSGSTSCVAVNTGGSPDADYFKNNLLDAPLNQWDFSTVWQTTAGLPTHRAVANANPGPPINFQASIGSLTSIVLSWEPPSNTGSSAISGYSLSYQREGESTWREAYVGGNGVTDATISGLVPATHYTFKLVAQNQDGYWSADAASVAGTTGTPGLHLITTCQQLQDIRDNLEDNYELANNIDCSDTINWNGGAGFDPIGDINSRSGFFSGLLEGNNYSISDLYIHQSGGQYALVAPFEAALNATFQDVRIVRPVISGSGQSAVYGAGLVVFNLASDNELSSISNVHVTDAQITLDQGGVIPENGRDEGAVVGGLVALSNFAGSSAAGSNSNRNEFRGTMHVGGAVRFSVAGGLYGIVRGNVALDNSFARANIEVESTLTGVSEESHAIGGLVGSMQQQGDTSSINHSYASGSISLTTAEPAAFAGIGGLGGFINASTISNSFARVSITNPTPAVQQATGGLLGGWTESQPSSSSNNAFDADVAGAGDCMSPLIGVLDGCSAISGQPNYFYNNSTNAPLDTWDFANIWNTTSTLPVFDKKVLTSITAIPQSRLAGTTSTPTIFPQAGTAAPAVGPVIPPKLSIRQFGEKYLPPTPVAPLSLIEQLKKFFRDVPAVVLVSFPYVLFSLLLIGALALLIEVGLQAKRLRATKLLIARQESVAKERDTFWHLAANYLRAPITLMVGGVELLSDERVPGVDKLQASTSKLQAKVGGIMQRIEESKSLQDIARPQAKAPKRVFGLLRFWLPVVAVAVLALAMDYVATGYRQISLSAINLGVQLMILVLVAMLFYWVLGSLGVVKSKRKQAEALLKRQTASLDEARSTFIAQSATELGQDLEPLQAELNTMSKRTAAAGATATALAIIHEGTHRLRDLIDSFELLVAAQNNKLDELSPEDAHSNLTTIVDGALEPLRPLIVEKGLTIRKGNLTSSTVAGNTLLLNQVVGSVLSNAVAFSPAHSTIDLSLKSDRGGVRLSVTNQGKGISRDEISHVFSPLTKADGYDGLQLDHDGLGVNLYIDKLIMEHLGGGISVASSTAKGTTMTMQWPQATTS